MSATTTIEVAEIARLRLESGEVLVIRADWDADTAERAVGLLHDHGVAAVVIPDASVRLDVVKQEAVR